MIHSDVYFRVGCLDSSVEAMRIINIGFLLLLTGPSHCVQKKGPVCVETLVVVVVCIVVGGLLLNF